MKNLSYIAEEISKGKDLSINLEKYGRGMSSMYECLGLVKMSMNYFTLLDLARDFDKDEIVVKAVDKLNSLIGMYIEEASEDVKGIEEFLSLRNEMISIMEIVTAYIDRLRIYEHVLNRVEFKFSDNDLDEHYYNTDMTNDIMHYILSDKDNVVINSKISEIVGQLPVRMMKQKFFEYISDAFTLYHGAGKNSIDDFYYALSTCACVSKEDGFERFPDIKDIYDTLVAADYTNIDEDEYNRLRGALDIASQKMSEYADIFVIMTSVINDSLTVLFTQKASLENIEEVSYSRDLIKEMRAYFNNAGDYDAIVSKFEVFEGKQERILETVSAGDFAVEYALANYKDNLEQQGLLDVYISLSKVVKLQSGSEFVSIDGEIFEEIPDNSYADNVANKLIKELDDSFKNMSNPIKRAVMATVLSSLPVFFNNVNEIQDYINNSLIQCTDVAERKAVVELIRMLIDND